MSKKDYEAIAKIIEDVLGEDTLTCLKILEGIRFYLDNKVEKTRIINNKIASNLNLNVINEHSQAADKAMKAYTERLKNDSIKNANN